MQNYGERLFIGSLLGAVAKNIHAQGVISTSEMKNLLHSEKWSNAILFQSQNKCGHLTYICRIHWIICLSFSTPVQVPTRSPIVQIETSRTLAFFIDYFSVYHLVKMIYFSCLLCFVFSRKGFKQRRQNEHLVVVLSLCFGWYQWDSRATWHQ